MGSDEGTEPTTGSTAALVPPDPAVLPPDYGLGGDDDGNKFVVHIDEAKYRLIFNKVFLALKNTSTDYDGEIELDDFDTEEEAAVARSIAKAMTETKSDDEGD